MVLHVALTHRTEYRYDRPVQPRAPRRAAAAGPALPHADPRLLAAHHARAALHQLAAGPVRQLPGARGGAGQDDRSSPSPSIWSPTWRPSTRSTSSSRRARRAVRSPTTPRWRTSSSPTSQPLPGEPLLDDYLASIERTAHGHDRLHHRPQPHAQPPTSPIACAWSRACRRRRRRWRAARAPAATPAGCWCRSCAASASPPASSRAT